MTTPEARARAEDAVAERFTRFMNASTSRYGVLADLGVAALAAALPLVLIVRQFGAGEAGSPLTFVFGAIALVPIGVALGIGFALRGARAHVVAWLERVPVRIENLNTLLVGLGDTFELVIRDGKPLPTRESLQPALDRVSEETLLLETHEDANTVVIKIGVFDSKRVPLRTNYLRYERFQRIVEEVLVPVLGDDVEVVRIV